MSDDQSVGDFLDSSEDVPDTPDEATMPDEGLEVIEGDRSCDKCAKQDVCAVFGNVAPQIAEELPRRTGGDPAFDPVDLAIICEMYDPE